MNGGDSVSKVVNMNDLAVQYLPTAVIMNVEAL